MQRVDSRPVAFGIEVIDHDDRVEARAVLDVEGAEYLATAEAMRTQRTTAPIATHLAVARALRSIETAVMETVHERIDRFIAAE